MKLLLYRKGRTVKNTNIVQLISRTNVAKQSRKVAVATVK